ncbi:hypothetical protein PPRY_a0670 [Pseudoalteromonas prydzensis ACAM 620]|nr:hypothetical protein [Pseudoalteromonas prydzensis ACAM 620]
MNLINTHKPIVNLQTLKVNDSQKTLTTSTTFQGRNNYTH